MGISDDDNDENYDPEKDSDNSVDNDRILSDENKINTNKKNVIEEETGHILPGGHRFDKKLISLRYPGKVIHPEKAIETLGGLSSISTAINAPNRRLELRFRPSDGYCKPACGDRHQVAAFLLRVRVKKSQIKQMNESFETNLCKNNSLFNTHEKYEENLNNDENYRLPKLKVIGRVSTEFRFSGLCDFQFLPIMPHPWKPDKNQCIYELTYPIGILPYKWLDNEAPYFLPPAVFSRMDSVQQYSLKTESKESGPDNVIGKTRKRRAGLANFITFHSPFIPTSPPKGIEVAMKVKFLTNPQFQLIRSLFEERPIWSKTALVCRTNFTNEQLKILLPSVAYYFLTGPWRIMWVKLGYDPRKDPSARIYQTLDYRLKSMHGLEQSIKGKRTYSNYVLPYKSAAMSKPKTAILTNMQTEIHNIKQSKESSDNVYIYREGTIPPSRQMFYQYCDVHVEEIQEMLAKLPDPIGIKCHEKRGWLPSGFSDHCREIINKQVRLVLRKKMNIPEDHPTSLPKRKVFKRTAQIKKDVKKNTAVEKLEETSTNESNIDEATQDKSQDGEKSSKEKNN
ncbi:general transcription factor 3C polypeptide 5 [Chelonus insularis]|uniref:general transcription factor 3C polypeptide 5 n=1 Tax=Chelonus insularis TaxID=460826 RepID=UPI00158D20EC|nr:general transcription factor 3C polypeptide 5 [Chelonus insularis]